MRGLRGMLHTVLMLPRYRHSHFSGAEREAPRSQQQCWGWRLAGGPGHAGSPALTSAMGSRCQCSLHT